MAGKYRGIRPIRHAEFARSSLHPTGVPAQGSQLVSLFHVMRKARTAYVTMPNDSRITIKSDFFIALLLRK
jgi:hypothetical protein